MKRLPWHRRYFHHGAFQSGETCVAKFSQFDCVVLFLSLSTIQWNKYGHSCKLISYDVMFPLFLYLNHDLWMCFRRKFPQFHEKVVLAACFFCLPHWTGNYGNRSVHRSPGPLTTRMFLFKSMHRFALTSRHVITNMSGFYTVTVLLLKSNILVTTGSR